MEEDVTSWPRKIEVQKELGISERTLDRRISELGIKKGEIPVLGRKPIPVLEPAGVAELKKRLAHAQAIVIQTPSRQLPKKLQRKNTNGHAADGAIIKSPSRQLTNTQATLSPPEWTALGSEFLQRFPTSAAPHSPDAEETARRQLLSTKIYLTLKEAAECTGLPQSHLKAAKRKGKLLGAIVSGQWRFHREDLLAYRVPK